MNSTFRLFSFGLTAKCTHIAPYRFFSISSSSVHSLMIRRKWFILWVPFRLRNTE